MAVTCTLGPKRSNLGPTAKLSFSEARHKKRCGRRFTGRLGVFSVTTRSLMTRRGMPAFKFTKWRRNGAFLIISLWVSICCRGGLSYYEYGILWRKLIRSHLHFRMQIINCDRKSSITSWRVRSQLLTHFMESKSGLFSELNSRHVSGNRTRFCRKQICLNCSVPFRIHSAARNSNFTKDAFQICVMLSFRSDVFPNNSFC